jgi:hypothetical protein
VRRQAGWSKQQPPEKGGHDGRKAGRELLWENASATTTTMLLSGMRGKHVADLFTE